jgi:FAD/FMN-containing dehydrogenase
MAATRAPTIQVATFKEIAESEGAIRFDWAEKEEERRRLWKARHDVYWAIKTVFPGRDALATDVCVPISRLAECVVATQQDIEASGLIAPIVGHVGDGNFHTTPGSTAMIQPSAPRWKPSLNVWWSGPSPWRGPVPGNTVSGRAKPSTSRPNSATVLP